MKPSFFSKQPKGPSELDTLRDTTKLLSLRMGRLESDLSALQETSMTANTIIPGVSSVQLRQLEDDFIASQTRIQAFHESIASAMAEMNTQLQALEFRLTVFEKRQALLESRKGGGSFHSAKAVFEKHQTKDRTHDSS